MRRSLIAVAVVVLAALTGCGGDAPAPDPATQSISSAAAPSRRIPDGTIAVITTPKTARPVQAYSEPAAGSVPVGDPLPALTPRYRTPLTLPVDDRQGDWLHVTIPGRPHGRQAWVPAASFTLRSVRGHKISVDLAARRITVEGPDGTRSSPVAVGSPRYPTPTTGDVPAFVTDLLHITTGGAYGHTALGLSLRSRVLTEFAGSDGQVGIHGTNEPASIGKPVSHGCIRVPPAFEAVLAKVPVGTPVVINP